ncbi:hypothetical protein LSTR_LSTR002600 [Laodelphax striatellus]|uniref:Thioredoxin domain-containing protein n=1 Tax=Laodelphax striatellus TaxID=195883 RepID=A0A482XM01_LAOST|nr:hypothetical protein LSTR_LSTR002600 [Laodelphax striatellus]
MSVMPVQGTDSGDDENLRGPKNQNPSKMYIIGREICFIFAIVFTTYAAVLNSNKSQSKSPPPSPFFRKDSYVTDYYHGELRIMLKKASEVEFMFIMYYAPWDAECQALRKEFEMVAEHHHKQVFFAAINCWQPGSECRSQASKIPIVTYPEFIAYPLYGSPVGYTGQRLGGHMIRFIDTLLHPVHRIDTLEDLHQLQVRHDTLLVGSMEFFNMRGGPEYKALYDSALKLAEKGTNRDVGVAVITNSITAAKITITKMPSLYLFLWNEVKEYTGTWKAEAIVQWVMQNISQVVLWLSPPGSKSLTFKPFVDDGSVLILFTPDNPLLDFNNHYEMLREIGLDYYNCKNDTSVIELLDYFSVARLEMIRKEELLLEACLKRMKSLTSQAEKNGDMANIPVQIVENVWINSSSSGQKNRKKSRPTTSMSDTAEGWLSFITPTCSAFVKDKVPRAGKNSAYKSATKSPALAGFDHRSATSLIDWKLQEKCNRFIRAVSLGLPPRTATADNDKVRHDQLMGLVCKTNHSLSLIAMDSNIYQHFADGLGIDLSLYPHRTAAVIFNGEQETVHLLSKPLTKSNLADFIIDFTAGRAERYLRSEPRSSLPPNRYKSGLSIDADRNGSKSISLLELTSQTFQSVVLNETQNVVVFYHSPYCAFCHGISHIYLTVANLLRNVPDLLFTRIDGESNDLPWEFTVHHYPSILFLPAQRKSESRIFPQKSPVTVDNLSHFVLANLNVETRLQGMIEMCSRWGSKHYVKKQEDCLLGIRRTCLGLISKTLSAYRSVFRSSLSRKYKQKTCKWLLKRLRFLKDIHLYLGTSKIAKATNLIKQFQAIIVNNADNEIPTDGEQLNQSAFIRDEL